MYLIVGLGNVGEEYKNTRHNVGFMLLDKMVKTDKFSLENKFQAETVREGENIFAKPVTFMNESGRAVRKIVDFFKIPADKVIVIHDDLDIAFGEYKIQKEKGPKVHNGVNSVEQYLGTVGFWRVRVGIDNRQKDKKYGTGADYVLSRFNSEERERLGVVFDQITKDLLKAFSLDIK